MGLSPLVTKVHLAVPSALLYLHFSVSLGWCSPQVLLFVIKGL